MAGHAVPHGLSGALAKNHRAIALRKRLVEGNDALVALLKLLKVTRNMHGACHDQLVAHARRFVA